MTSVPSDRNAYTVSASTALDDFTRHTLSTNAAGVTAGASGDAASFGAGWSVVRAGCFDVSAVTCAASAAGGCAWPGSAGVGGLHAVNTQVTNTHARTGKRMAEDIIDAP